MEQFFVVYKRNRLMPAEFEGDTHDILEWLRAHRPEVWDLEVCNKTTGAYVDAGAFIMLHSKIVVPNPSPGEEPTLAPMMGTIEEKMLRDDLMDPHAHERNVMVYQLIRQAMRLVNEPHYDAELLAKNTAHGIVRLFY